MKTLALFLGISLAGIAQAQQIRIANTSSKDPIKLFSKLFIVSEENDSLTVNLTILANEKVVAKAVSQQFFPIGTTATSAELLFECLIFSQEEQKQYYHHTGELPPGKYSALWTINTYQKSYSFDVVPDKFDLDIQRVFLADLPDSLLFTWPSDSHRFSGISYGLRWKYLTEDSVYYQSASETDCIVSATSFPTDKSLHFWIEKYYLGVLVGQTRQKLLIPNPSIDVQGLLNDLPIKIPEQGLLTLKDSLVVKPNDTWKLLRKNTRLYGSFGSEFFSTSNDYAYSYYGRSNFSLFGSSGIDIYGFPVKANYLANWYQNTGWQLADISIEPDFERFKQNLENKLLEQIKQQKRELYNYPELSTDFDTLMGQRLQDEIRKIESDDRFKKGKDFTAIDIDSIKSQQFKHGEALIDQKSGTVKDSLKNVHQKAIDSLEMLQSRTVYTSDEIAQKHAHEMDSLKQLHGQLTQKYKNFKEREKQYKDLKSRGIDIFQLNTNNLQNPELLKQFMPEKLKKYGNVLLNLNKLEMGWSHANFSDFTLSDKAFHGINIDYQSDKASIKGIRGTTTNGFLGSANGISQNTHNLNAVSIGVMKFEGTTIEFNYVDFKDRNAPLNLTAQNKVVSFVAKQKLYKGISIEGELAQSYAKHSSNTGLIPRHESPLESLFNFSNSAAQAYSTGIVYQSSASQYGVKLKRIGSGFQTLGNPFVYNDRMGIHFNARQGFFQNKLMLFGQYAREVNNLSRQFTDSASFVRYQLGIVARVLKKLNLTAFYMPIRSHYSNNVNVVHTFNGAIDMNDKIASVKMTVQLNYSLQTNTFSQIDTVPQTSEIIGINTIFISRKGNRLRMASAISSSRSLLQQKQASTSYSFKWGKKLAPEVYIDYSGSNLFGERFIAGGGVNFHFKNNIVLQAKLGYSTINRSTIGTTSSGIDTSIKCSVSF